ncbi:hypothetical protein DRW41_03750 [Neobacillus piezotolerans]|uniref:Uncharacterized protein n=1 Tax=Neobacillus piezotolerans TaxID=2259171 RepID=A0A3D8GW75_9BACI|nr:SIR2 family protein [Neobacillus piezotolerans]RDU38685.1 hypothetical protein DRW41_03750 [Neobacillus piezotolerans]
MYSDQHHIEKIRESLIKGNASVMVGAGFSLNATHLSKSKGSFLTWSQLIDKMKCKLYFDEEARKYAPTDPLKLAAEFEFEFGREALDKFLKESLPDNNYTPAQLHKMLLSLPWVDIFTTNYDTLIEKTREFIYDRNYSLVQTVSDIPNSIRPRIVKLHGSFPSHRPFIFTEEDYRTYPNKFSPFINLVQQSIMENTLCLIGFSGDDPNFKNWIGWVRDNLGDYASSIYFCGFLTESQKRSLESIKIRVIDFGKLFTDEKRTNNYKNALQWFFLELMKPEFRTPYYWPEPNRNNPLSSWSISQEVKEKLSFNEDKPTKYNSFDYYDWQKGLFSTESIINIAKIWEEDRSYYPQWVVAPRKARNFIWNDFHFDLIQSIVNSKTTFSFKQFLFILHEILWRLEVALLSLSNPRFNLLLPVIEEIVDKFGNCIGDYEKIKKLYKVENKDIDVIEQQCIRLCFSLVNYYREQLNNERVYELLELYEPLINKDEELQAESYYNQCLIELNNFNYPKVFEILNNWTVNYNIPYWQVRRASILIALREISEAENILITSLNEIRRRNVEGNDIELLSQESWILRILNALKKERTYKNIYNNIEKENYLKTIHCDANQIYEEIVTAIDGSLIKQPKQLNKSFDPGTEIISFSFNNQYEVDNKNALQLIRMMENTGHRFKINNTIFDKERVIIACEFILPTNFMLALITAIQLENKDFIKSLLSREIIATLEEDTVCGLFTKIYNSLIYLNNLRINHQLNLFEDKRFSILLEILSRLTIKLSREKLDDCLSLGIDIFMSVSNHSNDSHLFDTELNNLFKRTIYALDDEDILNRLKDLLNLPVAANSHIIDPFYYLDRKEFKKNQHYKETISSLGIIIETNVYRLIEDLKMTKDINTETLLRLITLDNLSTMSNTQKVQIGNLLLGKNNIDNTVFYFKSLISHFFQADSKFKESIEAGIKSLLERKFVDVFGEENGYRFSYSSSRVNLIERHLIELSQLLLGNSECINFTYFRNQFLSLIDGLEVWWTLNRDKLKSDSNNQFFIYFKRFLYKLLYVSSSDKQIIERIRIMLNDLETRGFYTVSLLPLISKREEIANTELTIIYFLHSNNKDQVFDALEAIKNWIDLYKDELIDTMPEKALDELIQKVFLRRLPYLEQSIKLLIEIINLHFYSLSSTQFEKVIEALKNIYDETEIKAPSDEHFVTWRKEEFLSLRAAATKLAHDLYVNLVRNNQSIPEILRVYQEESENNIIPDLRKQWN